MLAVQFLPAGGKDPGQAKSVDIPYRVSDQPFYNKTKRADLVSFQELYLGSFKELDAIQS